LIAMHQVHHYWYRGDGLQDMCFYDFCRFVRLELKEKSDKNLHTADTRLGVLHRHALKNGHDLHETHVLVEHTNADRGEGHRTLVPRVVGIVVPRKSSADAWSLFTLAHFKPFSVSVPLFENGQQLTEALAGYAFSEFACHVMRNWEAMHECEDARDADRLRK
jgi:hypothetical protein